MPTLQDCIDQVRQRLNLEFATHITDAEIANYLNASFAELYEFCIDADENWNVKRLEFTIPSNFTDGYVLPEDVWKIYRIDRFTSGSQFYSLSRINMQDESLYTNSEEYYYYTRPVSGYLTEVGMEGTKLRVFPESNQQGNYRLVYYPAFTDYGLEDEVKFGPSTLHLEEYGIVDTAIKCCIKEETDASGFIAQKAQLMQRVKSSLAARDVGQQEPPPCRVKWYNVGLSRFSY